MMQQQSLENQHLKQQQLDLQQQQTLENQRLKQHQMELQQQQAEAQLAFQQQQAEVQQVFQKQLLSLQEQQRESEQGRLRSDAKLREESAKRNKQKEAIRSLRKMGKGEDIGFFLQTFENKLTQAEVPREDWTRHLPVVLTAHMVESWIGSVPDEDYERAKAVLLDLHSKPASHYVTEAYVWTKPWGATPGEVIAKVQANMARLYMKDGGCPFAVIMHATLSAYGNECINHALAKKPTSPHKLATAISDFEATHGNATRSRFRPSQPRQGPPPYRVEEKPRQHEK